MSEFIKPRRVSIDARDYLDALAGNLEKDLQEGEEVCQHCHGTGLVLDENPYGLSGDPDRKIGTFPYHHQSITFCHHCFNGVARRCEKCGSLLPKGSLVCDCDKDERFEKQRREKWEKCPKVNADDWDGGVYFSDQYFSEVDEFRNWYEDEFDISPHGVEDIYTVIKYKNTFDMLETSDEAYEDYEVGPSAAKAIRDFCAEFRQKHAETSLFPTNTGIVFYEGAAKE